MHLRFCACTHTYARTYTCMQVHTHLQLHTYYVDINFCGLIFGSNCKQIHGSLLN